MIGDFMETNLEKKNNIGTENFDMQTLMNIVGQNAMTVQGIMAGFNETKKQIGLVTNQMADVRNDVSSLNDRMTQIENNEEATTEQVETIKRTIGKRVDEILGSDKNVRARYYRTFIARIYTDARTYAGCGSSVSRTRKCNFQRVLNYVESWEPSCGVAALMKATDEKAKANREEREKGYDC